MTTSQFTPTPARMDPSSFALRFDNYIMSVRHDFPILFNFEFSLCSINDNIFVFFLPNSCLLLYDGVSCGIYKVNVTEGCLR